jgi:hypothetical protein
MTVTVGKAAAERTAAREVSKILRLAAPWALVVFSFPLALLAQVLGGGQPLGAVALTLGTFVVSGVTWLATRSHGPMTSYPAVLTAGSTGLWLTLAAILGVGALWLPWLGIATVLATCHNVIAVFHRGGEQDSPQKLLGNMLGLEGSRLGLTRSADGTSATGTWEVVRGRQTAKDAQHRRGLLASAAGVAPDDVTINEGRDHGVAPVRVQLVDVHKDPRPWPGPSAPGGPATLPVPVGIYRDNTVASVRVVTPEHGARHQLTTGASGAGKTTEARVELCELMTRRETTLVVIDCLKAAQSLACVRDGLDLIIDNASVAQRFLADMPNYIQQRSGHLGALGLDNWRPGCGLNFVKLQVEEAHQFADTGQLVSVSLAARSVGIQVNLSVQRPVYTQIDTTVRAQLANVLCFGLTDENDARIALGDQAIDAGADPSVWGVTKPGMAYLLTAGTDDEHRYMPLRGWSLEPPEALAHTRLWAPRRDPVDEMTAAMFPEMLSSRVVIPVGGAGKSMAAASERSTPSDDLQKYEPMTPDPMPLFDVDLDAELGVLADAPLANASGGAGSTENTATPEEARSILIDAIRDLTGAGHAGSGLNPFSPGQLHDVTSKVGRSRTWIYEACRALARDGIIAETDDSKYQLLDSAATGVGAR